MRMKTKLCLAAAALLGLVACQRESVDPVNPTYNKETNEVVTNFVFNVSTSNSATKQSSAAVQASSTDQFRGISNAALFAYKLPTDGKILAADDDAEKVYDLATVSAPGSITSENSRRVIEMSLPLMTNTLLFYGKAPQGTPYGGWDENECFGLMEKYYIGKTKGSTNFKIGSRLSETEYQKFQTVENMFAGIQTLLLNHKVAGNTEILATAGPSGTGISKYGFDVTVPTAGIKWEQYADGANSPVETDHERYPLEDKLYTLFKQLTTIRSGAPTNELRAGSGEATLRMAKDILQSLNEIRRATPMSAAEAVAKYFANEVYVRMTTKYFIPSTNDAGDVVTSASFAEQSTIATAFLSDAEQQYKPGSLVPSGFYWPTASQVADVASYDPAEFPFNFHIPRGATHLAYDSATKCFYYPQTFDTSAMGGTPGSGSSYNAKSYFYPAELMYYGNSPVRTTSKDKKVSDYPNGSGLETNHWENNASWGTEWNGTHVVAATRAVAMKYDIQYGTAMLATRVQYKDGLDFLYDNNHKVQELWAGTTLPAAQEPDNHVPITSTTFKMTGLIIGGQSKAVGWDYLPVKVGSAYQYGFIYDKAVPEVAQTIPASGTNDNWNYTMVLDNFHAASVTDGIYTKEEHQDKVYVAIEFQNNSGMDFYGNGNLIREGGYFYLIGCLDPEAAGLAAISWPTDRPVPPYKADGTSQEVTRVFIQDFLTKATFTLGENSLHYAYLTVPDLRSSSMSLGLSVDLKWETGLNFEDVLLGGN